MPEFIGHEDEQPRFQPCHHAAMNKGCDEIPPKAVVGAEVAVAVAEAEAEALPPLGRKVR